jgi:hypothetical protein
MKTFRIDRKKWLRGESTTENLLWCADRKAGCCLGHVIHQTTKCSWDDLESLGEPKKFYKKSSMLTEISVDTEFSFDDYVSLENNRLAQEAMLINDDVMCSDEDREKDLKDLFNRHGYNLEFYN